MSPDTPVAENVNVFGGSYDVFSLPVVQSVDPTIDYTLRNSIDAPFLNGNQELENDTIFTQKLVVGAKGWVSNIAFSPLDYQTAQWASGTIQFSDGTSLAIVSGNTGAMTSPTWIYLDKLVSGTVLQITTTYSAAISDSKIILAYAAASGSANGQAVISVFGAPGTTIDGAKIVTGKVQSADGRTYFDLDNSQLVMSDGTNPRVVIGTV